MSPAISPTDDPGEIAEAQIPDVAASGYRERAIREYLLSLGGTDGLSVNCAPGLSTARIDQDSREEAPTIKIPARNFSQRTHDYSQEIANRLIQYGLALHEHGHDRHTAGPFLKEIFNRAEFSQPYSDLYWDCINGLEDYRIETALIEAEGKWAKERLMFTHQNFTYVPPEQTPDPENVTWGTAIQSATIHYGKARESFDFQPILEDESNQSLQWRSPRDKQIYYAVLPEVKQTLEEVGSEPSGKAAARRMMEFVHTLDQFLNELSDDPPERDQEQEDSVSNDADDSENDMGSEKESADSLEQNGESDEQAGSEGNETTSHENSSGDRESGESGQKDDKEGTTESETESDSSDGTKSSGSDESNQDGQGNSSEVTGSREREQSNDADQGDSNGDTSENSDADSAEGSNNSSSKQEPVEVSDAPGGENSGVTEDSDKNNDEQLPEEDSSCESGSQDRNQSPDEGRADQQGRDQSEESESKPQGEDDTGVQSESAAQSDQEPDGALVKREARKASREERKLERDKQELEEELTRLQEAMAGGDGEVNRLKMVDRTDETGNDETWEDISTESAILKGPLQQSLQQSQETSDRRGTRTGTFDPALSRRLSVSNLAINKQTTDGQQKSYSVILVLDRSSSMSHQIASAETAVGGFAVALEELGVNVAIVDLYRGNARMVKPFGTAVRQVRGGVTSGKTGGGTPLTDALIVSRERVRQEPHFPFMFVVSDGKPFDKSRYSDALEKTTFPVVGVTLTQSSSAAEFDDYYDVSRAASADGIGDELVSLATEIMF